MSHGVHEWVLFLGRFHPLLVHLPIGGLVLLGILELLARLPRFKDAAQNSRLILGLTTAAAISAALLGWMLSQSGGYDPQLLPWHKWTGFSVAAACAVTWLLNWRAWRPAYRLSLGVTLVLLVVASHLGGSITHGRDFLTQHAPETLRALLGSDRQPTPPPTMSSDLTRRSVFEEVIQPILQQRCATCHGPEKHKGGLSMESHETLLKGGNDGRVLVVGKALDSPMIYRLLLPLDDDDHMPPQGKPQLTLVEIAALQWWIDSGAPVDKTVADLKPSPEAQRILGAAQAASKQ